MEERNNVLRFVVVSNLALRCVSTGYLIRLGVPLFVAHIASNHQSQPSVESLHMDSSGRTFFASRV